MNTLLTQSLAAAVAWIAVTSMLLSVFFAQKTPPVSDPVLAQAAIAAAR